MFRFWKSYISSNAELRLDGIPALDLWDLIFFVLGNTTRNLDRTVVKVKDQRSQG